MKRIEFDDFKKFLERFRTYFDVNDLRLFIIEVELLTPRKREPNSEDSTIDIDEIAAMIRNDIQMMPRWNKESLISDKNHPLYYLIYLCKKSNFNKIL